MYILKSGFKICIERRKKRVKIKIKNTKITCYLLCSPLNEMREREREKTYDF